MAKTEYTKDEPLVTLRGLAINARINPDLLLKLNTALTAQEFNGKSTLYDMGYFQAQADFRRILNYHLNTP